MVSEGIAGGVVFTVDVNSADLKGVVCVAGFRLVRSVAASAKTEEHQSGEEKCN
jgi:hypothetical protein